jgi:RHS repeat-associated protein
MVATLLQPSSAAAITPANAISYVHDDLGRLEAVIDPGQANGLARYAYDGAGNLLSIMRQSATAVTIVDLHPKVARRNTQVTIYGAGFSATPSQNIVRFGGSGGTQATVVSATATQLVVTVPTSGAINGPVFVSSPSGQVSSTQTFAEDISAAPTISGFNPQMANSGATVTISGSGFDPVPERNNVFFNGIRAQVTSASPGSLQVLVPPFLTSGKIAVQTAAGEATSAADFVSPPLNDVTTPRPYFPSEIDQAQRIGLGTAVTVAVTTAGHASLVMFDANEDQRVFIDLSTFSGGQARVRLLDPFGREEVDTLVTASQNGYLDTKTLYSAGTYMVLVDPLSASATGSMTVTVYDVPVDPSGQIATDGTPTTTGSVARGQAANYSFGGTSGQRVSLVTRNSSIQFGEVDLIHPDTWEVTDHAFGSSSTTFMDPVTLPATGTFTLRVDPSGRYTGQVTLELYDVPPDPTPAMTIGGPPTTVSLLTPGQNAYPTFPGAAGQTVRLTISNSSITNCAVRIRDPNGQQIASTVVGTSGGTLDASLAQNGTYTIVVDPTAERTGSLTLSLSLLGGASAQTRDPELQTPSSRPRNLREADPADLAGAYEPPGAAWSPDPGRLTEWNTDDASSPLTALPPLVAGSGVTALSGQVLAMDGRGLPGVALTLGEATATTDAAGRFLLEDVRPGHRVLEVDAATPEWEHGSYEIGVDIHPHRTSLLDHPIWLPRIDLEHAVTTAWPAASEVVITTPEIPGLELRIPAGASVVDEDGEGVDALSITPVPLDRAPFPLPAGVHTPAYFTIQPGGAYVVGGLAQVVYPNYHQLDPGTRADLWLYEPDEEGWEIYGQGTVSADGTQIVPDAGAGVYEFTGVTLAAPHSSPAIDLLGNPVGDPIDPATGLFDMRKTDLALPGPMPIEFTRLYRQGDPTYHDFGLGIASPYEAYLDPPENNYLQADLIMAGERRVHFDRISPGTSFSNDVMRSAPIPGPYYRAMLSFHSAPNRWHLTRADGATLVFGDVYSDLREIRDRFGNRLLVLGANGTNPGPVTQLVSYPSGRWISLSYNGLNRVATATDNLGRTVTYTYEATLGRLKTVTDANQTGQPTPKPTTYTWTSVSGCSPNFVMTAITDPRNIQWMTNTYGTGCRVTQQTVKTATATETWDYAYTTDAQGRVIQTDVTNPKEVTERLTFDADGYLLADTVGLGTSVARTFTYTRGADHLATRVQDSFHIRNTDSTYDSFGNPLSVTGLAGSAQAVTTQFTHEPVFQQLSSIVDPLNHATSFAYDAAGCLDAITDGANRTTTFECNSAGQVTSMTDPLNHTTTFTYSHGDLVAVTDALGRTSRRFVDGGGRVLSATNPLGQTTTYAYDKLNQLTALTDAIGGQILFSYDPDGNLTEVNDRRRGSDSKTTFAYNNMNLVSARTDPLNRTESFSYDDIGNLTSWTDRAGQIHDFTYDPLDRLLTAKFKKSGNNYQSTLTYTWDVGGRLTQVADSTSGAGTITRTYDDLDRLLTEGSLTYGYDAASRRTSTTVSGQPAVTYGYNPADQLTAVTKGSTTVSLGYDGAGRLSTLSFPTTPALVQTYGYNAADQLTAITYQRGTNPADDLLYTLDPLGRRTAVSGSFARTGLPTATTANAVYDAANRLTSWNGGAVTYDNNGNLLTQGGLTYAYNARNQLTSVKQGNTTLGAFVHDGLGRRVQKTISGTVTKVVYDGWNVIQEKDSKNKVTANMLAGPGLDQWFSRIPVTGSASYYLTDALGSTVGLADPTGTVATSYTYEPFGRTTASGTTSTNPFRFIGREEDSTGALSLYHYRARYYSPTFGRFLTEDPIGLAGGDANLYGYVGNAPIVESDSTGLFDWPPIIGPSGFGWTTTDGPRATTEWVWDRILDFSEVLSDWWSRAQKDWEVRALATELWLDSLVDWFRQQISGFNPVVLLSQCISGAVVGATVGVRAGAAGGHPVLGGVIGGLTGCVGGLVTPVTPPAPGP